MIFARADAVAYTSAENCQICEVELGDDGVRGRCHPTGAFRGATHGECNLRYKMFYPLYFDKLPSYDSQIFIKQLAATLGDIDITPSSD